MRIAARFNGPVGSGNGGITAGRLAAYVGAEVVEVTLRRPPPLDRDLRVDASGGTARLYDADVLVAEAVPAEGPLDAGPAVDLATARAAEASFGGLTDHPYPTCFGCGTERTDGLGLRPGPVGDGAVAAVWTPAQDDPALLWAALDCPGGWSYPDLPNRPLVLGRIALQRVGPVDPGRPYVVTGWTTRQEGRKVHTGTALRSADGELLAMARATWLTVDRSRRGVSGSGRAGPGVHGELGATGSGSRAS